MIQANELRIGNWVKTNSQYHEKGFSEIIVVCSQMVDVRTNGVYSDYNLSEIEPIPITPELLQKAGFQVGREGYWFKSGVEFNFDAQILVGFGFVDIKYLHQLQNLFYALTGEELQIDL